MKIEIHIPAITVEVTRAREGFVCRAEQIVVRPEAAQYVPTAVASATPPLAADVRGAQFTLSGYWAQALEPQELARALEHAVRWVATDLLAQSVKEGLDGRDVAHL